MGLVTNPHSVGLVEENFLRFGQTEMLPFKSIYLLYGVTSGLCNYAWLRSFVAKTFKRWVLE